MKRACCKKAPACPYDWSRAGLEIKVVPVLEPRKPDQFGVLFRRGTPHYILYTGTLENCNVFARGVAFDIGRAIDFELGVSRQVKEKVQAALRASDRAAWPRFYETVDAMLQKPPRGSRRGRERRTS